MPAPLIRVDGAAGAGAGRPPPHCCCVPDSAARRRRSQPTRASHLSPVPTLTHAHRQLEEDLADDLKWSMLVKNVMFSGKSKYQEVDLIDTGPFGKTLFLDGKVQSSEVDEWVYHELLVHPAMILHPNPKTVFICGGELGGR